MPGCGLTCSLSACTRPEMDRVRGEVGRCWRRSYARSALVSGLYLAYRWAHCRVWPSIRGSGRLFARASIRRTHARVRPLAAASRLSLNGRMFLSRSSPSCGGPPRPSTRFSPSLPSAPVTRPLSPSIQCHDAIRILVHIRASIPASYPPPILVF